MALAKKNIVYHIQNEFGDQLNRSVEITKTLLEIIKLPLDSGEDVLVSGFGKFCVQQEQERKCRNPTTGSDMMLPARRIVTFKCSGKLREMVNGS